MITITCPHCGQPIADWLPHRIAGRLHLSLQCCGLSWQVPVQGRVLVDGRSGEVTIHSVAEGSKSDTESPK